ncbi:MAG: hypothetical protein WC780_04290 [Lentimicrobiaceae bacterium]|jgi:hypothetical protein
MTDNRINFSIPDADQTRIDEAFTTINDILKPFMVVLSDTDRKTLPKMADATLPFVEKVASYAVTHPQFKPDYVNAEELATDVNGFKTSNRILASASQLVRLLEDISILSGSEAYSSALSYYRNVKVQSRDGRPGAKTVCDDLQQRFEGQGKRAPAK